MVMVRRSDKFFCALSLMIRSTLSYQFVLCLFVGFCRQEFFWKQFCTLLIPKYQKRFSWFGVFYYGSGNNREKVSSNFVGEGRKTGGSRNHRGSTIPTLEGVTDKPSLEC